MRAWLAIGMVWTGVALAAGPAAGLGIESHVPPSDLPEEMLPAWVKAVPPYETHEFSPPLREEVAARKEILSDVRGEDVLPRPRSRDKVVLAESEAEMPEPAKAVVRWARVGKWQEAVEAAQKLFRERPVPPYGDFTWDYAANAAAWAYIQSGQVDRALDVHKDVLPRLNDPAVQAYHRFEAAWLAKRKRPASEANQPNDLERDRAALADEMRAFEELAARARSAKKPADVVRALEDLYAKLRFLVAAQPSARTELVRNPFRPVADALVTEMVPRLETQAEHLHRTLETVSKGQLRERQWPAWNRQVTALWAIVAEAKRLCRIQDYLARVGLAREGLSEPAFRRLNRLLFVRGSTEKVWQPLGQKRRFDTWSGIDLRFHVPYLETPVRPMDGPGQE